MHHGNNSVLKEKCLSYENLKVNKNICVVFCRFERMKELAFTNRSFVQILYHISHTHV